MTGAQAKALSHYNIMNGHCLEKFDAKPTIVVCTPLVEYIYSPLVEYIYSTSGELTHDVARHQLLLKGDG